ncbi:hypothetical protein BROUX41_005443 [Berkeleyomyces rouxiae]|uniref:uncharacterized protein n=1 Tax=Berkeleyomyces rouxiae TaxID=2035830 RepID=UPI003B75E0D0
MSDHPHDSSLSPKLGSWPLSDSSHVDHQKAAKYIPQIGNVDSVQYARLHGLFEPLLLEPYKILRHHQRRSYWDVDLLNDDHLPGFLIPHCVVSDDQSFESDGYASHVIRGDITPVDSDSVTTFMHTVIERNIKLALPLLRSDNDRDLAEFFAMRRCYQHFDIKEFVLPLEPVDETHDEGMEFPESAVHLLCLLESEAEFETLESLDLADEWLQSSLADIKETLSYDDVFMTRHAPAVSYKNLFHTI